MTAFTFGHPKIHTMLTAEESDYIGFMNWFQNNHPDLYASYWQEITPPVSGQQVSINKNGMPAADYAAIILVTQVYYKDKQQ